MINEISNYLDIALDVVKTGSSEFNQNILNRIIYWGGEYRKN